MELQGIDLRGSGRKAITALLLIGVTIFWVRLIVAPWIASFAIRGESSDHELSRSRGVYPLKLQFQYLERIYREGDNIPGVLNRVNANSERPGWALTNNGKGAGRSEEH